MFTVSSTYNKQFGISIGTGTTFHAGTLQEVVYGLEHYFDQAVPGYSKSPFDRTHHREHQTQCGCCPLCKSASPQAR